MFPQRIQHKEQTMMSYVLALSSSLLLQCLVVQSTAIPQPDKTHDHTAHVNHFQNPTHDINYDHEQFLGEDEAKTFDQLPPEESRRRLG